MAEQFFLTKMILMYTGAGLTLILLVYTGLYKLIKLIQTSRNRKKLK